MDSFAVLAVPTRRDILHELRRSPCSVNELVDRLGESQPTVSKHLKVLRDGGFVTWRGDAQQRIYRVEPAGFTGLVAWLEPFVRLWNQHLDRLEQHLDDMERSDEATRLPTRRSRRDRRPARR